MTRQGTRRLDFRCSEQGKLPAATAFKLAERDKHMSEQKKVSFMQELDIWIDDNVIDPLTRFEPQTAGFENARYEVRKAIRGKVLESYHNGQAAKGGKRA
jgi:hypothetical protein